MLEFSFKICCMHLSLSGFIYWIFVIILLVYVQFQLQMGTASWGVFCHLSICLLIDKFGRWVIIAQSCVAKSHTLEFRHLFATSLRKYPRTSFGKTNMKIERASRCICFVFFWKLWWDMTSHEHHRFVGSSVNEKVVQERRLIGSIYDNNSA